MPIRAELSSLLLAIQILIAIVFDVTAGLVVAGHVFVISIAWAIGPGVEDRRGPLELRLVASWALAVILTGAAFGVLR